MPYRIDRGQYTRAEKLPNGFLRTDAVLTRTGVFTYRNPDGTERRELRLPEEVFKADSMRTLQLVPVTREHPGEPVTDKNATRLTVGAVGNDVRQDGNDLIATVMLHDEKAVAEAESGERRDVSCGYWTDLEKRDGSYMGERYDCIQRNIRYNHVALTTAGRAGNARLRLDSDSAEMVDRIDHKQSREQPMHKLILDGVTFETDNAQLAQAVQREIDRKDGRIKELEDAGKAAREDAEKEKARADAAEKDRDEAQKAREDAEKPERVQELVSARLDLERTAEPLLREQLKKDNKPIADLSDKEIKSAIVALHDPDLKLDDKEDVYLDARYDAAIVSLSKRRDDAASGSRRRAEEQIASPRTDGDGRDEEDPAEKFKKDSETAWKKPLHKAEE